MSSVSIVVRYWGTTRRTARLRFGQSLAPAGPAMNPSRLQAAPRETVRMVASVPL
ncbi:MAG TPA: hypothetical protein VNK43_05200 [Gemmatimonadales bacterium]|nr:hypothetical protein [Gemmatimonadales bacterium]